MPEVKRKGSIEISEDVDFQRKSWRVQRVGWVVMLLIAAAALLGLFGDGPLASAEAGAESSGLVVRYQRFTREGDEHSLDLEVGTASLGGDSSIVVWLDRRWLSSNRVLEITPAPDRSQIEADRILYTFNAARSSEPVVIRFDLEAQWAGRRSSHAGVSSGPTVMFSQFAYP